MSFPFLVGCLQGARHRAGGRGSVAMSLSLQAREEALPEGMGKPQERVDLGEAWEAGRRSQALTRVGRRAAGAGGPVCKVGLHRAPGKAGRLCARGLDLDRWAHWLFQSESVAVKLGASTFISDSCLQHVSRHTALLCTNQKKKKKKAICLIGINV